MKHLAYRTEQCDVAWVKRFILFYNKRHPRNFVEATQEPRTRFFRSLAVVSSRGSFGPLAQQPGHWGSVPLNSIQIDTDARPAGNGLVETRQTFTPLASNNVDRRFAAVVLL